MTVGRSSIPGAQRTGSAPGAGPTPGPGKQTLTSQLDEEIVQQRANERAPGGDVHAAAAHGTSGAAAPLPYLSLIQQSFGRHDVGQLKAHVGGAAAEGAGAMGADAFATGDHVAFAGAPDLHTAAHEAAHVVQQRGGVQLKGGVGEVGDPYEQHADAVADLVVQGKSSEALLDQHAGPHARAAGPSGAVQRHAFINGKQVKKTDPSVTGAMVDFVTDVRVRDYLTMDELKNHVAGQTDYLGNLPEEEDAWVRFSPTGLNVLGEMHDTGSSLMPVMQAVGGKSFISEAIATDDLSNSPELNQAYETSHADRFKTMGIDGVKDKTQYGAESLLPKMGFAMTRLLPYLNVNKKSPNIQDLTQAKDSYNGKIYQSLLKEAWAHGLDVATSVASQQVMMQPVPPKRAALAKAVSSLGPLLDAFITGLPHGGFLGDALTQPANAALILPISVFARALSDAMIELAIDDPTSRLTAKQKKKFGGKTTDTEKADMFSNWRNFEFEDSVKAAAARGVRYAGMGYHHLKHLRKVGMPANAQGYDMMIKDLEDFKKATASLKKVAIRQ